MATISRRSPSRRGFTLVELLVVIAIIGLLVSILLPSVHSARRIAQNAQSLSNYRGIMSSTFNYSVDYGNQLVSGIRTLTGETTASGTAVGGRPHSRFVFGADPYGGANLNTTLGGGDGLGLPRVGMQHLYADRLMDGDYVMNPLIFQDPGKVMSIGRATGSLKAVTFAGFKTCDPVTGGAVAAYAVTGYGITYIPTSMFWYSSFRTSTNANQRYYYGSTAGAAGLRHFKMDNIMRPSEGAFIIDQGNSNQDAATQWGYPNLGYNDINDTTQVARPGGGSNAAFFDGHAETVKNINIYTGLAGGFRTALTQGPDGNRWPDPAVYPNFRPNFWDWRNLRPLGGTTGDIDNQNRTLGQLSN